jgi:hypothetical protein
MLSNVLHGAVVLFGAGMSSLALSCSPNTPDTPKPAPEVATIAGTEVPSNLHCEEDEVISLLPSPFPPGVDFDKIGCVHIDVIRGEAP